MDNDFITKFDTGDSWYQVGAGSAVCDLCGRSDHGVFFLSGGESVCLLCSLESIKVVARDFIFDAAEGDDFTDAIMAVFDPEAPPFYKMGMLLEMDNLSLVLKQSGDRDVGKIDQILRFITLSIGYDSGHPLSPVLRTIAVNKIILFEDFFIKTLIEDTKYDVDQYESINPVLFSYYLSLILAYIAPYNSKARDFVVETLGLAGIRGDSFVNKWFNYKEGYYFSKEDYFSSDIPLIRFTKGIKGLNRLAKHKNSSPKSVSPRKKIKPVLEKVYSYKQLMSIYKMYLQNIIKRADPDSRYSSPGKKTSKSFFVGAFSKVLLDERMSSDFLNELPKWVRTVFEEILWEERFVTVEEFMRRGGMKIPERRRFMGIYESDLPPETNLFKTEVDDSFYSFRGTKIALFFEKQQAQLFRSVFPLPDGCKLKYRKSPGPKLMVLSQEDMPGKLKTLAAYIVQVGLKRTKKGDRVLKSSLKAAGESSGIQELYKGTKDLGNIRTAMAVDLVEGFINKSRNVLGMSREDFARDIFSFYFDPEKGNNNLSLYMFLDYLMFSYIGHGITDSDRNYQEKTTAKYILDHLEVGKWVDLENLYMHLNSKELIPQLFELGDNADELYFKTRRKDSYSYGGDTVRVSNSNKGEALHKPHLKALMVGLNILGVVDIAYANPVNKVFHHGNKPWLSPYDGIKAVTLSPMGQWLVGKAGKYDGFDEVSAGKVVLDDKRLIVTVEGENPIVEMTLSRISRPLGSGNFIVSPELFLQDCKTENDVKNHIKVFKASVSKTLPPVWKDFFNSLLKRVNPFDLQRGEMYLFRLDPDNKELISLLFTNPRFRRNIIKVEDYQILVPKESYGTLKRKLKEFGYLLP